MSALHSQCALTVAAGSHASARLEYFEYPCTAVTKVAYKIRNLQRLMTMGFQIGDGSSDDDILARVGGCPKLYGKLNHNCAASRPEPSPEEALGNVVLMGAHGGIAGGANLFPQLFVNIYDAAVAGDIAAVCELQERMWSSEFRVQSSEFREESSAS